LTARLNIVPDPAFLDLRPVLSERLSRIGATIHAEQFRALLDPLMRQALLQGFAEAGAHDGAVWLLDETSEHLEPVFGTGGHAERLIGHFKQPLNEGLICMVFASERPFLENDVWKNEQHSQLVDTFLDIQTCAMIAVPFYFLQACRGVVSCVQLKKTGARGAEPPGFRPEHLASVQRAAATLSRLIELRLLSRTIGWTSE
jgi:hypothetical protein